VAARSTTATVSAPGLATVVAEWGRIGCIGFGGPPAHIALLRRLCVERRSWIAERDFEDALAACNLLPGPASTQMAIYCAWRVRGRPGAVAGGLAFVLPGLVAVIALAAIFLAASPPDWILGAGAGAGAAVAAVALQAGASLVPTSWKRAAVKGRWAVYLGVGVAAAATVGPWVVLVLLGCGLAEISVRAAQSGNAAAIAPLAAVLVGDRGGLDPHDDLVGVDLLERDRRFAPDGDGDRFAQEALDLARQDVGAQAGAEVDRGRLAERDDGAFARRPGTFDELDDTSLHAMSDAAEHHAEGSRRLALALAGMDDQQAFLDGLGGDLGILRGLAIGHFGLVAGGFVGFCRHGRTMGVPPAAFKARPESR